MTKNLFAHLVGFACALFLWESQSLGQNLSGTSLSVSGTGSISVLTTGTATINLLTSGTASFNEVSVTGVTDFLNNTLYFGTSGTTSALSLIYDDGGNSSVTLKSTKPSAVWNWQRLTSNGTSTATAMQLDASNRLILTGTAAANPPQLVLDPNGAITVNGSSLLTQTDADARYITSSGTAAYALASNSAASLSGTIQASQIDGIPNDSNQLLKGDGTWGSLGSVDSLQVSSGNFTIGNPNGGNDAITCIYDDYGAFIELNSLNPGWDGFAAILYSNQSGGSWQVGLNPRNNNNFEFATPYMGTPTVMCMTLSGNVGIGTSTPQATLDVQGTVRCSGPIRVEPQGDLDMGEFVTEPSPEDQQSLQQSLSKRQTLQSAGGFSSVSSGTNTMTSGTARVLTSGTALNR